MSNVPVYLFKKYDIDSDKEITSSYYATRKLIQQREAIVIEESAIEIEESMLEGDGIYKPKGE